MMKATKYFLILLAVVALFAFACKTEKEEIPEENETVELSPIDQMLKDMEDFVVEWQPKAEEGKANEEVVAAFMQQWEPIAKKSEEFKEEDYNEEQKAKMEDLGLRMAEIMQKLGIEF